MRMFYVITKLIVFPGAYIRGFWEQLTCRILKLMVEPGGYIRLDEACGHVEHSLAKKQFAAYLIATGPGFMNFNIGFFLFMWGFMNLRFMGITVYDSIPLFIIYVISMYLGVSFLCCLFPLTEDVLNYWSIAYTKNENRRILGSIFGFLPMAVTRLGAFLEKNGIIFILWVAFLIWQLGFKL